MDTLRRTIVAGMFLGLAGASAPSQRPLAAQAQESSGTRQMRCVVKVTADRSVVPLSFDLVEALLRSEGVGGKAIRRVANEECDMTDEFFHIVPLGGRDIDSGRANPSAETDRELPGKTRTVLFELRVHLPDAVQPRAREFDHALIENLRSELNRAFHTYVEELEERLRKAQSQQKAAHREFEDVIGQSLRPQPETIRPDPADEVVYRQLDQVVNLSTLEVQTSAEEAFETLRKSIDPPLRIIVLWRDLLDNADIQPSSPIDMDGLSDIRLGAALDSLLRAISNPLYPDYPVEFAIDDGVITVATRDGLPRKAMETRVYDLPPLVRAARSTDELIAVIQETMEPESWSALYPGESEGAIMSCCDVKLVVRQSRDVQMKIQGLLRTISKNSPALPTIDVSEETLRERLQALLSYRDSLEADLNRRKERQEAIRIERSTKISQVVESTVQHVITELRSTIRDLQITRFDSLGSETNSPEFTVPSRTIDRIEQCIDRCDQIIRAFRPDAFMDFRGPLWLDPRSDAEEEALAKQIAGTGGALVQVNRRIAEIGRTLAGPQVFDPEVSRIQAVSRNLRRAEERVHDLSNRITELEPCSVVVMGEIE